MAERALLDAELYVIVEITADLGCPLMNSEFNGRPERAAESEAAFWRSLEELLPLFEREGLALNPEAHPDDFCEENTPAVDLVRAIDKPWVNYLYCAPHSFHLSGGAEVGADIAAMMRYAGDKLKHVHIADSFNHKGSSGLRYILDPPGTTARIHRHLDIGQGEVDWDAFFGTLRELDFDGVATACVFAWEERAKESSAFMLDRITKEIARCWCDSGTGGHLPRRCPRACQARVTSTGSFLMPLTKLERTRGTSPTRRMSARRGISSSNMMRISVRASRLPRHRCGLPLPKVTWSLSARATSKS